MHVHSPDLRVLRDTGFHPSQRDALRAQFWGIFHASDLNALIIDDLLSFLFDDKPLDRNRFLVGPLDRLFLDHLFELKRMTAWTADGCVLTETRVPASIDARLDQLTDPSYEWTMLRTLNHVWQTSLTPARSLAVVTSIRNEGMNIIEWLAHYRVLGADSIFVYVNDNDDGSDALLGLLADAGIIRLIHNKTDIKEVGAIKHKVFNHALTMLGEVWNHEWLFFVDPDEFFIGPPSRPQSLPGLIDDLDGRDAKRLKAGISFNWKWFGSERERHRGIALLLERYARSRPNSQVKTLARLRDITGFRTAHMPRLLHGGHLVDAALADIPESQHFVEPTYAHGQINHYWNKSFEEFIAKRQRGWNNRAYSDFFNFGNRDEGDLDPAPPALVARVKAEAAELSAIPGVAALRDELEERFAEAMAAFDRVHDIAALYVEAARG